jgi:hypothetical protein
MGAADPPELVLRFARLTPNLQTLSGDFLTRSSSGRQHSGGMQ